MKENNTPVVVAIKCLVYNHEPYLRQCLDGFVMQKTNFVFVAIVHEDCSTDGSADIIREYERKYPDIIKPIYEKENQYIKHDGSLRRIVNDAVMATGAKYIACCEGDDYWTDSYKLQKQVDILERHPDVTLVYTGFNNVDVKSNVIKRPYYEYIRHKSKGGDILHNLMYRNFIMTLTVCYRRKLHLTNVYINNPAPFDYGLSLAAAMYGKIAYIPMATGNYRLTPGSMITSHKETISRKLRASRLFCIKCFLQGEGMKRLWYRKCIIEYNIIKGSLYDKEELNALFREFTYLKLYCPVCLVEEFLLKIFKKFGLISKYY